MQIDVCFLLNSVRCTAHFKNCFGAVGNVLCYCCLVFVIVESCWFGKDKTLQQGRMAMLCASHLSSSENECCFCFSFSRIHHCGCTSIMLNLQIFYDIGCVSFSKVTTRRSPSIQLQQCHPTVKAHLFPCLFEPKSGIFPLFQCPSCLCCLRATSAQLSSTK